MSDNKHFRSEEARKHYEQAERQRAQAKKRKALNAKMAEMSNDAWNWVKQYPLKALVAAAVVIAVIALAAVVVNAVGDPLRGKQDNWLIINTAADSRSHDYRHLANFDMPEGYTRDEYSTYADETTQDFFCIADDKNALVQDVYISGSKALRAADFPTTILSYGFHKAAGEPRQLTVAGKECSALYLVTDESEYYGEGMTLAHMSFYFDTAENACVTATFRSDMMPFEQLPDEAAMLAEAERILANRTLVK